MQYILSLLPVLACPVGMGLMMWLMMRGNKNKEQATYQADKVPISTYSQPREVTNESPGGTSILKMLGMCLNWKVVAGLAVVGLFVLVLAPQFVWVILPLLIVAACPLSMLIMMRGMQGGRSQFPIAGLMHDEQLPPPQPKDEAVFHAANERSESASTPQS